MSKLCIIYNTAPRYREAIFHKIDSQYNCDWFFGMTKTDIKEMDITKLRNAHYYKYYGNPRKLYWKSGIISKLFNSNYSCYLILSESRSITDYFFIALKNILFPHKRIYAWTHGLYGKESKFELIMKLWQFKHVDGVYVYNDYSRKLLLGNGISANKVITIYNSLHYDEQVQIRNTLTKSTIYKEHFHNDYPVLLFIGRLTVIKKLDMILHAVRLLKEEMKHYNIVFVGDGVERRRLEALTSKLDICDNVWFYGICYDEALNAELIYNADLCVAPGNVGLTAMHSMVFGTPVLTHSDFSNQMPEFEAIIPNQTGTFFKYNDIQSLKSAIDAWFANKKDRESIRENCFGVIDSKWNPHYQINVLKNSLIVE